MVLTATAQNLNTILLLIGTSLLNYFLLYKKNKIVGSIIFIAISATTLQLTLISNSIPILLIGLSIMLLIYNFSK